MSVSTDFVPGGGSKVYPWEQSDLTKTRNAAVIRRYNAEHGPAIIIRQVKYLDKLVEQDHRSVKRVTRPMLGFKSFEAAQGTLAGIELMHMLKKGQLVGEEGAVGLTPVEQFYALAA